jgi:hypothetical protein
VLVDHGANQANTGLDSLIIDELVPQLTWTNRASKNLLMHNRLAGKTLLGHPVCMWHSLV